MQHDCWLAVWIATYLPVHAVPVTHIKHPVLKRLDRGIHRRRHVTSIRSRTLLQIGDLPGQQLTDETRRRGIRWCEGGHGGGLPRQIAEHYGVGSGVLIARWGVRGLPHVQSFVAGAPRWT